MENTEYDEISFCEGSTLVVFSDGITESMDVQEEEYGEKRLFDQIEKGCIYLQNN